MPDCPQHALKRAKLNGVQSCPAMKPFFLQQDSVDRLSAVVYATLKHLHVAASLRIENVLRDKMITLKACILLMAGMAVADGDGLVR